MPERIWKVEAEAIQKVIGIFNVNFKEKQCPGFKNVHAKHYNNDLGSIKKLS
jgi:hypothetical protein